MTRRADSQFGEVDNMDFVLLLNPGCKEPAWYQRITSLDQLSKHQDSYVPQYWNNYWRDPHTEAALEKGDVVATARHPMNVLPKRSGAMALRLIQHRTLFINKVGGWCTPVEGQKILETRESKVWPASEEREFSRVKVLRWPLGNHYYLVGSPAPMQFSAPKFDTLEEAMMEARKHVPENRIEVVDKIEKFVYPVSGD